MLIGIDVGGTSVKLGAVQNGDEIVYRDARPSVHEPRAMARLIADMLAKARVSYPGAPAAISIAGAFNMNGGFDANQLDFWNVPLEEIVREAVGEALPIENDGVCALLAEHRAGALKGCENAVMLTLGTGIGGGVMTGGAPLRGYRGIHAELGHMITHADGEKCSCGQTGCWEIYASASGLSRLAGGVPPREAVERVRRGEFLAVWEQYLRELSQGLISLCSIFFPERIAIGGGLSNAGDILFSGVARHLNADPGYQLYFKHIQAVPARFLNDAGVLGAAALAERNIR